MHSAGWLPAEAAMPTPLGHALGGVAAGCLVLAGSALAAERGGGRQLGPVPIARRSPRSACAVGPLVSSIGPRRAAAGLACLGALADVDLLLGIHNGPTHSVGAALLVGAVAGALAARGRLLVAAVAAGAYGSHVLLDWLGTDPSAPHGVMALWPVTRDFYLSDAHLFLRVCREYWLPACWWHDLRAVGRELVLLAPVTLAALLAARGALRRGGPRRGIRPVTS